MKNVRTKRYVNLLLLGMLALWFVPSAAPVYGAVEHSHSESISRGLTYLAARQQPDGGFAEPGKGSSLSLTAWTICGITSTGETLARFRKSGAGPVDYLHAQSASITELVDCEKTCLALAKAGEDPRSFGGRDLVREIRSRLSEDGHIGALINEHCWGVIALKAAGEALPDPCRTWLLQRQNSDGGFGYAVNVPSDPDDTGAALQALSALGEPFSSEAVKRAVTYLKSCQARDGGFGYGSSVSNVASTAWAVQGLLSMGMDPSTAEWERSGNSPYGYLLASQQEDGHFRYSGTSDSYPAWMTAEVLPALAKIFFSTPGTASQHQSAATAAPAGSGDDPGHLAEAVEGAPIDSSTSPERSEDAGHRKHSSARTRGTGRGWLLLATTLSMTIGATLAGYSLYTQRRSRGKKVAPPGG